MARGGHRELGQRPPAVRAPRALKRRGDRRLAPLAAPALAQLLLHQQLEQHAAEAVRVGGRAVRSAALDLQREKAREGARRREKAREGTRRREKAALDLRRHVQVGAAARVAARRGLEPARGEAGAREPKVA